MILKIAGFYPFYTCSNFQVRGIIFLHSFTSWHMYILVFYLSLFIWYGIAAWKELVMLGGEKWKLFWKKVVHFLVHPCSRASEWIS